MKKSSKTFVVLIRGKKMKTRMHEDTPCSAVNPLIQEAKLQSLARTTNDLAARYQ